MSKIRIIFITESIRRDAHAPLKKFKNLEVLHFYLKAPYGDMTDEDLKGAQQVTLDNLLDQIIQAKPDVIQGAEPFGSRLALKLSMICLKAARATGAKLIVPILENRPINERFNLTQRAVLKVFCPKYFRRVDRFVALNKGAVKNILRYRKNAPITEGIIWGVWGVDLDLFKPVAPKVAKKVVYVGRLIEDKGLRYLIEGFKLALEKVPDLTLNFIGSGDYEAGLKQYVHNNNLEKSIKFLGYLKNQQLPLEISSAELLCYPSITMKRWEEQVGTVNFQALACGTPILTTFSGAIPEYIKDGEGAILVKEKSAPAIADGLVKFFTDNDLKKKLTAEARTVARSYDINKEIASAEKLIIDVNNA